MNKRKPLAARFWKNVDRSGECWVWIGGMGDTGYGQFWMSDRKRSIGAHRASYELIYGPIPKGLLVCHRCDNRACVRPEHLFLGSHQDNMADMSRKGRAAIGDRQHLSKLTWDQIREIRAQYETGLFKQREIAMRFGVDQTLISMIVRQKIWKEAA